MSSAARVGCRVVACVLVFAGACWPRAAGASGFFLLEQSARLQGTSYAGTAALAADASTVYYNPAGMSRIKDWSFAQSGYLVSIQSEPRTRARPTSDSRCSGRTARRRPRPARTDRSVRPCSRSA